MPSSSEATRAGLARAALLGLGLGLLASALLLLGFAVRGLLVPPDCTGFLPLECEAERASLVSLGRLQALAGVALSMLALSVFLLLKKRSATAPSP
jgi:hypothetical protein